MQKRTECPASVKRYWEIVADNLSKDGWSWGYVSGIDFERGEQCGSLTRTAATESGSLRADEKLTAVS